MERAVGVVLGEASVGLTVLGQLKKSPSIGMLPKKGKKKLELDIQFFFSSFEFWQQPLYLIWILQPTVADR